MARYYFNIKDGETVIPDPNGDELPEEIAALENIREAVEDIVRFPEHYGDFYRWARREFIVTDESGRPVLKVPVPAALLPDWRPERETPPGLSAKRGFSQRGGLKRSVSPATTLAESD